jgi:hypothetical protein
VLVPQSHRSKFAQHASSNPAGQHHHPLRVPPQDHGTHTPLLSEGCPTPGARRITTHPNSGSRLNTSLDCRSLPRARSRDIGSCETSAMLGGILPVLSSVYHLAGIRIAAKFDLHLWKLFSCCTSACMVAMLVNQTDSRVRTTPPSHN